jgi:D-sedoheptulose 7-phosphate isomerase
MQIYLANLKKIIDSLDLSQVEQVASDLNLARLQSKHIFICGNGGSSSTADHMAVDLSLNLGFLDPKMKVSSLSTNASSLTATGNDIDFDSIFSRQLEVFSEPGDLVIFISASGNSKNLIKASGFAKTKGLKQIGIVGFDGGKLLNLVDTAIHVKTPIGSYGVTEDIHLMLNHILVEILKVEN